MSSAEPKRPIRRGIPRLKNTDGISSSENGQQPSKPLQSKHVQRSVIPVQVSNRLTRPTLASQLKTVSANGGRSHNGQDSATKTDDASSVTSPTDDAQKRMQAPMKRKKPSPSRSSPFQVPDILPQTKKNPTQERKKCTVQFQPTIDTQFGMKVSPEGKKKDFKFTGANKAAPAAQEKTAKTKPKVARPWQHSAVTKLKEELAEVQSKLEQTEKENWDLSQELHDKKKKEKECQDLLDGITLEKSTLEERISLCETKLEQCHIDPVTMQTLDLDKEAIDRRRQEAKIKAASLRSKLKFGAEKNEYYLRSLKEINEKCEEYLITTD